MLNEKDTDEYYDDDYSYLRRKNAPKKKLRPFIVYLKIVAGICLCLMFKLFFKRPPVVQQPSNYRIYNSNLRSSGLNFRDNKTY
ncbi:conserved rodent malaria protein, unknown function [Plasmodium berghei]|uniref:Uncharacterized protein n=2 Tax=Plasmodium berghei TaxID=5821 RepID=A0A509AHE9_PLABA|nr:conserved rodent malaria protein, unknown function [Plasmodium berghei ANKA]CXI21056.1 conserved rodent malaria protein, unknown function [Plasmodium berghei]SBW38156.1 conserved rodent malaria protein, unknown function [Plasmodium berghei]SCL81879.1 conserved rodent malaria protein, unknown function [Plasmodium berghei]SCL82203.1 conserved rodent malaria protein, unknown function [Plasmodium berghei]SCL82463.1 conserved rodent malaria protein, unknown function [Plasmodium berghei]|eukprot:XP_034420732.1 conserved rodent malaria protein, unknown function [Plasmodium berghei ANKA]